MSEIPLRFKGLARLDSSAGFLKGAFVLKDVVPADTEPTFHVVQKGLEIRWPHARETSTPPKLIDRLFRAVGAKKEIPTPVTVMRLQSVGLAQAFREEDQVQIHSDKKTLGIACTRQGQLAFALGQIGHLLPLKGAANLLFETLSEAAETKDHLILRTSLRPLELKPGRVLPLGYYNISAWKSHDDTPIEGAFISVLRSGISLTMEDLKRIVKEWALVTEIESSAP